MNARFVLAPVAALALAACGGSNNSSSSTPTTPSGSGNTTMTVNIVGQQGAQSFSPNPVPLGSGALVAWRNNDGITHRIVLNDGSFDSGDIPPGAVSQAMRLASSGGNYHCAIHPTTMFGSINVSTTAPDPGSTPPGY